MPLIPCPCCHGTGKSYDPAFGEVCTACKGSKVLDVPDDYEEEDLLPDPQLELALFFVSLDMSKT